jgi:hypothetical protein
MVADEEPAPELRHVLYGQLLNSFSRKQFLLETNHQVKKLRGI